MTFRLLIWSTCHHIRDQTVVTNAFSVVKPTLSFLKMFEGLLLERVDVGRQRSSSTSCYNPTGWITITCTFLERVSTNRREYEVLRKGFEAKVSPLTAIYTFSDVRSGKIKTDFYDDCQDIPDPSTLDPWCCWTIAS